MTRLDVVGLALAFLSLSAPVMTWADELQEPLRPVPDVAFNPPACGKPLPGAVSGAHLIARSAERMVGPYRATLDAFSNPGEPDTARPILIEADAGTTLRIDLDNQMPTRTGADAMLSMTNLHTHGLIVRPKPYDPEHPCPGDSVYQHVPPQPDPASLRQYRIDIPASIPASMFGLGGPPIAHPSGLFWFHAHLHTVARPQVTSGLSGLISIGDPMTHLRVDREDASGISQVDEAKTRTLRAQTDVKYLALRDIQLAVPACPAGGGSPCDVTATLPGHPGSDGLAATVWDYDPALCPGTVPGRSGDPYDPPDAAFCAKHVQDDAGGHNVSWMFTVNGQFLPDVTVGANRNQLWRIANLSASLTYVLELTDTGTPDPSAGLVQLCVISLDGVVTGSTAPTCSGQTAKASSARYDNVGFGVKQLLLMPGSRAEIFLAYNDLATEQARTLFLRTAGLNMGNSDPATQGDVWPPMTLARVMVAAKPQAIAPPVPAFRANLVRTGAPAAAAPGAKAPTQPVTPPAPPSDQGALLKANRDCVFLPAGSSHRRQLIFDEYESGHGTFDTHATYHQGFALGSRVVDRNGHPDSRTKLGPVDYGATGSSSPAREAGAGTTTGAMTMDEVPTGRRVCAVLGRGEVWELTNWTTETHNFHIHQGKFRLAKAGDPGLPAGFNQAIVGEASGTPIMLFLTQSVGSSDVQAWHDTLPVPPRLSPTKPGQVFVYIPFEAEQQVGSFVFHCHILEHEDRGMMADIEVVRPVVRPVRLERRVSRR